MSLFQVRQWWEIKCGHHEEYDQDHLIVGDIDNDPNDIDKIITASLQGIIRIYLPTNSQYKVEHLILELDLKQPILQIALGKFLSNDQSNYLAILHSRQLCVYLVKAVGGYGAKAQYYELTKKYNHNLDRNAFSFIYGAFGRREYDDGSIYSDSICVQSLDGKFWVFEQEHLAFSRDWNNFLIPGCIVYSSFADSIITITAEMKLYSYSYAVLSTSEQQKLKDLTFEHKANESKNDEENGRRTNKSFHRNWCINLCDHAIKIICARFTITISPSDHDIIVLCERGIFAVSSAGVIKWQKKVDYNPSTMVAYKARHTDSGYLDNIIVANFQNSISIYSRCTLIWSARISFCPIDIRIGSFGGINGMQVMLSDEGQLIIGYLGTDPSGYQPVHVEKHEADWDQIEQDMKESKELIRQIEDNEVPEPTDFIAVSIDTADCVEWIESDYIMTEKYGNELVCDPMSRLKTFRATLNIKYCGNSEYGVSDIQISIDTDKAFVCNETSLRIEAMNKIENSQEFELIFYSLKSVIPHSLACNIYTAYLSENDKIQTDSISFKLPFSLLLYPSSPIKNTLHSFTLEISGMNVVPSPTELFSELINEHNSNNIYSTPQVLTLIFYCNNSDVTMLLSRKGGKMRIQCGSLYDGIWIVIDELIRRLQSKEENVEIRIKDELPLNDYLEHITNRYNILTEIRRFEMNLDKLCNQFRVIQKRLLTRYKNKNPTPLNEMDVLLKKTFENIINDTNKIQNLNKEFVNLTDTLWCFTRLIWILIFLKYNLDNDNMLILKAFLSIGTNEIECGWEEEVEASMVYALTTCLAKSKKDTKISQHIIGKIKDIQKVTRHIKIVCDRIDKGQRFTDKPIFI